MTAGIFIIVSANHGAIMIVLNYSFKQYTIIC